MEIIKAAMNISIKRNSGISKCLAKEILNNTKSIKN